MRISAEVTYPYIKKYDKITNEPSVENRITYKLLFDKPPSFTLKPNAEILAIRIKKRNTQFKSSEC